MKTFTLIGYWTRSFECWWEFGTGKTADEAVKQVLRRLKDEAIDIEDLLILGVIEGRHTDAIGYSFTGPYGLTEPLTKESEEKC